MARPQQFQREQVLHAVTQLFWRRGYNATSIEQLLAASGISRATLYASFGGKAELFEQALEHYFQPVRQLLLSLERPTATPLENLQRFFELTLLQLPAPLQAQGCLLVNSSCELADNESNLAESARRLLDEVEQVFVRLLRQARQLGQIQGDPALLARWLMNSMKGLRLNAREQMPTTHLQQLIELTFHGVRHASA